MLLDVKFDSNLSDMKQIIQRGGAQSISRAINDSLSAGKTKLKSSVCAVYNIKKKDVEKATVVFKSYPGNLKRGKIVVESRLLSTYHFSFSPKAYKSQKGIKVKRRKKATVTFKKGQKKSFPHGFIVNPGALNNGYTLLWKREGKNIITPIRSISIAQMVENENAYEPTMKLMEEKYNERLVHHLKRQFKVEE